MNNELPLTQEFFNNIADMLESYLSVVTSYCIFEDLTQEEYDNAIADVRKCIGHLRKGKSKKIEKIFDYDEIMKSIESGDISSIYVDDDM